MEKKERTKLIKINGIKTRIILPPKVSPKEVPDKVESKENHPKGLFLRL